MFMPAACSFSLANRSEILDNAISEGLLLLLKERVNSKFRLYEVSMDEK